MNNYYSRFINCEFSAYLHEFILILGLFEFNIHRVEFHLFVCIQKIKRTTTGGIPYVEQYNDGKKGALKRKFVIPFFMLNPNMYPSTSAV